MNFENKFNELNTKIEIKAKHTIKAYDKYFEDINQRYGSELESFIQNSINNQRDALLTELIQKRNSQINKINQVKIIYLVKLVIKFRLSQSKK